MVNTRRLTLRSAAKNSEPQISLDPVKVKRRRNTTISSSNTTSHTRLTSTTNDRPVVNEPDKENVKDGFTTELIGREEERNSVREFIESCLINKQSGSLYISGAPGTGKTAVVSHETQWFAKAKRCRVEFINCMQLTSASDVFHRLYHSLVGKGYSRYKLEKITCNDVEVAFEKKMRDATMLLVLDEVDQLSSKSQDILYKIFDWPSTLSCHLIIIGIANALDLPERLLPRLLGKSHKPKHLIFRPYSRTELCDIVSAKLGGSGDAPASLDSLAIQLCARKVSASTGDVRTALGVCHRAIDLALKESQTQPPPLNSQPASSPLVQPSLRHISMALKESQASNIPSTPVSQSTNSQNPALGSSNDLPLHHKLVILSAYHLRKQHGLREIPFSKLSSTYSFICSVRQLISLEESELISVCGLLDSRGYVQYGNPKGANKFGTPARFQTIRLRLDNKSVEQLFTDDMFSQMLRLVVPN